LERLRSLGFVAGVVERWLPRVNLRRDLFHCIDLIAVHARDRIVLGVQATSMANISARLNKARQQPELRAWLAAGARFEIHGWCKRGGRWQVKVVSVEPGDLTAVVLQKPRRRRPKGMPVVEGDLFAALDAGEG
jgi:hypothetical protein